MRRRNRTRKPIGKPSGLSDKERRMRRERERLDKPFRGPSKSASKTAAWGIINGLSYTVLILGVFILMAMMLFAIVF